MRNLGQTRCLRCHRCHIDCLTSLCIRDEQWAELQAYALENGRSWKRKLCEEWMNGSEVLRWARNIIGPYGLYKVKLNAKRYARVRRNRP